MTKAVPMAGVLVPPSRPRLFHLRVLFFLYIYLCCLLHRTVDWAAAAAAGCLASFGLDGVVVVSCIEKGRPDLCLASLPSPPVAGDNGEARDGWMDGWMMRYAEGMDSFEQFNRSRHARVDVVSLVERSA